MSLHTKQGKQDGCLPRTHIPENGKLHLLFPKIEVTVGQVVREPVFKGRAYRTPHLARPRKMGIVLELSLSPVSLIPFGKDNFYFLSVYPAST